VEELVTRAQVQRGIECKGELGIEVRDGGNFALASARLPDAAAMDAKSLEKRVTELYGAIAGKIQKLAAHHPVRFWNHIPGIHHRMDPRRDRYMVFNAGRYQAFSNWYGGAEAFD